MFLYLTEDTQTDGKYCAAGWVVVLRASEISEKSERKETSLNMSCIRTGTAVLRAKLFDTKMFKETCTAFFFFFTDD